MYWKLWLIFDQFHILHNYHKLKYCSNQLKLYAFLVRVKLTEINVWMMKYWLILIKKERKKEKHDHVTKTLYEISKTSCSLLVSGFGNPLYVVWLSFPRSWYLHITPRLYYHHVMILSNMKACFKEPHILEYSISHIAYSQTLGILDGVLTHPPLAILHFIWVLRQMKYANWTKTPSLLGCVSTHYCV